VKRLGVYLDTIYRRDGESEQSVIGVDPTDSTFVGIFLPAVARHFSSLLFFGRSLRMPVGDYVPLPRTVTLIDLPHYRDLLDLRALFSAVLGSMRAFWRGLDDVDTVWVFGPHPMGVLLICLAVLKRKQVILGIRQETVRYVRARIPDRIGLLVATYTLDLIYRFLALYVKTVVTGPQIARQYGKNARVFVMIESVIRSADLAQKQPETDWQGSFHLLTVGRLDSEKNPFLLIEAIARLNLEQPGAFRLTWIGNGPLEKVARQRANELGVADAIDFRGFVPFGPDLLKMYRCADAFVHVSFTEGVPKVLVEALACATPIVATDVGAVRDLLAGGQAGLLVPPGDLDSLIGQVLRISHDAPLRSRLVDHGLAIARDLTIETQSSLVAGFIAQ
jgi:glycosyltransferase involved in cell wall biosynthesis